MNTTSRAGWLALAFLCAANWLSAQSSIQEDLQRADKQFDLYAYNLALKTYTQVLDKDANNAHALARVADCYFQLNKPEESLSWYARAVQQRRPDSDVQLRYGKALMMKGDYVQARRQFLEYAAMDAQTQEIGRHYADMCDFAISNASKDPLYVAKNEPLNTLAADFGPAFLNNRLVYSSARTDIVRKTQSQSATDWSGSANNQLFVTQRNPENGYLQKPAFLRGDLQNNYNEGPVSYSADGKRVAFCRNNFINGTRQIAEKGVNMSLYTADVVNGEWTNVKAFPYNGSGFATGFPCLSPSGNTLIFASNNPNSTTGGSGWDIYVSNLVNGEWSTPRNVGAPLNTPGNEVTPFYDGTDLYFSSDWHSGLGGLDVFRAELGKETIGNIFHLGPGINSSYDDYGFIFNAQQNVGYLTSTRPSGRGNEDIWQIVPKSSSTTLLPVNTAPPRALATSGNNAGDALAPQIYSTDDYSIKSYSLLVTDTWGKPVPGVLVDMMECNRVKGQTDFDGKYYFSSSGRPVDCVIELNKTGYETTRIDVKEFGMHNIIVSMGLDSRQEYSGKVLDARTNQPLYGAVIEFKDGGKVIQTSTDVQGKYALMLTPLNNYDIEYSHDGYKVAKLTARPGLPGTGNEMATVFLEPAGAGTTSSVQRTDQPVVYSTDQPVVYSTNQPVVYSNTQTSRIFANETPTQYSTATQRQTTTLIPIQQPVPEPEFNGYSIQLAASPDKLDENSARQYEPLAKHGNLYVKSEDKLNKVRLGIFPTKDEASKKLKEVNKTPQFKGAFIVEERGADKGLIIGGAPVSTAPTQYSTASSARGVTTPAVVQNSDICYAVQLGSFSPDNPIAISDYAALSDVGNVYSKSKNGSLKMRLGVWPKYNDAEGAQAEAVKRGFKDAIIVTEVATDESIKGFMVAPKVAPAVESKAALAPTVYSTTQTKSSVGKYSIRLCALADPNRFDAGPLEAAGVDGMVEKRPIGKTGLTAILLSGYETQTAANRDKEKVRANGFPEAYLVEN